MEPRQIFVVMKEENVVYIVDIRDELKQMYGKPKLGDREFEIGYEGWRTWCIKHQFATSNMFNKAEKRQWLSKFAAQSLCLYLNSTYFWKCLR